MSNKYENQARDLLKNHTLVVTTQKQGYRVEESVVPYWDAVHALEKELARADKELERANKAEARIEKAKEMLAPLHWSAPIPVEFWEEVFDEADRR